MLLKGIVLGESVANGVSCSDSLSKQHSYPISKTLKKTPERCQLLGLDILDTPSPSKNTNGDRASSKRTHITTTQRYAVEKDSKPFKLKPFVLRSTQRAEQRAKFNKISSSIKQDNHIQREKARELVIKEKYLELRNLREKLR